MFTPKLGDLQSSEQLIAELYLDLRRRTRQWARVTKQTAQARMGYIGQHLVSIVTGLPGGRSGARGADLVHPDGATSEIKTCYRIDQLGKCRDCSAGVAPDEVVCSSCGGPDIERKDDSKWLISLRTELEFNELLVPAFYYLVLFEFTNLGKPDTIQASIWKVDPRTPGFILCMVDYYLNIRAGSKSKAPFNLWPYALKFELMRPVLIYRSLVKKDDSIETLIFPGRDTPIEHELSPVGVHARSKVSREIWLDLGRRLGVHSNSRQDLLASIEAYRRGGRMTNKELVDLFSRLFYESLVRPHVPELRGEVRIAAQEALSGRA